MLKLHKLSLHSKMYWKTWETEEGRRLVQWGDLGTIGYTKIIRQSLFQSREKQLRHEIDGIKSKGFVEIPAEDHDLLIVQLNLNGIQPGAEVEMNCRLQERLAQTLDWVGLGSCDGGIVGSQFAEVYCSVVDYEIGKPVIEADLWDTEFADRFRIYDASLCRRFAN